VLLDAFLEHAVLLFPGQHLTLGAQVHLALCLAATEAPLPGVFVKPHSRAKFSICLETRATGYQACLSLRRRRHR
jgi:hypothetical protein